MTRIQPIPLTYSCVFENRTFTAMNRSILLKHYRTVHKHNKVDAELTWKGSDYLF